MTLPFILVVVECSPLNRDTCSSCHFSISFPTFGGDLEQDIFEFVLHLLTIRLRVACSRCHRWRSFFGDMPQAHGYLLQGKAGGTQPMAEVMPQVMKGDIGDLLPLLSGCPLLDGAPLRARRSWRFSRAACGILMVNGCIVIVAPPS
jgi:hypothetical protein